MSINIKFSWTSLRTGILGGVNNSNLFDEYGYLSCQVRQNDYIKKGLFLDLGFC